MLGFIGDHFFVIPLAGAALFMIVVGFVSIEDALRRHWSRAAARDDRGSASLPWFTSPQPSSTHA